MRFYHLSSLRRVLCTQGTCVHIAAKHKSMTNWCRSALEGREKEYTEMTFSPLNLYIHS